MIRLATMLCGLLAAFAVSGGEARAEKRVALVIGNSAYQNATKLANPANDANAMAAMFRENGFDVVEARLDLGNLEFKRVAREFTLVARDADIAVMYYAGHGIEVNGTNYLLPVDAKLASDFDVEDEALSLDRLVRALEPARRLRLIILDACRDNPFVSGMQRSISSRNVATGLAKVEPAVSDTLIAFAAKAGSTADDGRGDHSPFTTALLKNLSVPGRDVRIALGYVRDEVVKATGNRQEPFVYGSLGGATVALVPEKSREIAVKPAQTSPAPSTVDPRRDYEFAERVGTKEAWDLFLSRHKTGFYADLARAQRSKLTGDTEQQRANVAPSVPPVPGPSQPGPAQPGPAQIAVLPAPAEPQRSTTSEPDESQQSGPQIAVLPPPEMDQRTLTLGLQAELKRVGCDPGTLNGIWTLKSQQALDRFNKRAGTKLDVKVASLGAFDAVKSQRGRICPLVCEAGERIDGDTCVAIPRETKPAPVKKKEAARPPQPAPRERVRERVRERAPQERVSRPAPRAACPPGSSPMPQGGRMCCEITPERGASRIFCP